MERSHEAATAISKARDEFLALVDHLRPELHRYSARLTGSVVEGEDIVQETLAKAFYAIGELPEVPPLRPWLFRIAHNTAVDFLKSHNKSLTDVRADMTDVLDLAEADAAPDPLAIRAALAHFLVLPVSQRSAVILKDVLGHSLEETAETMGITVMAVKAALVRGRGRLKAAGAGDSARDVASRDQLERYAALFNARDWDGVRALVADDCRLDLVSKSQRRGKQVGMYLSRYEKESVQLRVVRLDGDLALAAHVGGAAAPSYFILLCFEGDRVSEIRDFRYVTYIAREAAISDP